MHPTVRYTVLGFLLLGRIDEGASLSMDEAWAATRDGGDLFALLETKFPKMDLSYYNDPTDRLEIQDELEGIANAVSPEKMTLPGNNGLVLLAAYCFQAIQQNSVE